MHEEFGFKTKQLSVLRAHKEDAKPMCKLYKIQPGVPKQISEEILAKSFEEAENDFHQDVTFIVRDKSNKVIGSVETISEDGINVEIGIWIPNLSKRMTYLEQLIASMIEWCEEEEYSFISKINQIEKITPSGAVYEEIRKGISLKCAL